MSEHSTKEGPSGRSSRRLERICTQVPEDACGHAGAYFETRGPLWFGVGAPRIAASAAVSKVSTPSSTLNAQCLGDWKELSCNAFGFRVLV